MGGGEGINKVELSGRMRDIERNWKEKYSCCGSKR